MSNLNKISMCQKNLMADFMSKHSDLAKNILPNSQQGKATSLKLWQQLTTKLNAIGPPIKDAKGWRKTFEDQKYQIKGKMSFNKASKVRTGGGPFEEKLLTAADEAILSATGLDVAVEGIAVKPCGAVNRVAADPCSSSTIRAPLTSSPTSYDFECLDNFNDPSADVCYSFERLEDTSFSSNPPTAATPLISSTPPVTAQNRSKNKGDVKLSLLKEKIKTEAFFNETLCNKLDKVIELEERSLRVQERLLEIKEEKHQAFLELHTVEMQLKQLKLEKYQNLV